MKVLTQQLFGLFLPSGLRPPQWIPSHVASLCPEMFLAALMLKSSKSHEGLFLHLTWNTWLKCANWEGDPGPIGPVFHALIHIKGLQARLREAYSMWSKHSSLCKFYFMMLFVLCLSVTTQILRIIGRVKDILSLPRPRFTLKVRCEIKTYLIMCFFVDWPLKALLLLFLHSPDFVSRAAIIVHLQTGSNQGLEKKIR